MAESMSFGERKMTKMIRKVSACLYTSNLDECGRTELDDITAYYTCIAHALHMHCSEVTHLAGNLHCPDPTMWWSGFTRRPSLIILQTYFRHTSEILQIYFGHTSKNT